MSYYTKYRPQKISELDLDSVRSALGNVLTSGKFSHAYLFSGSKGTGKTSSARILAKVLNCEQNRNQLRAAGYELQANQNEKSEASSSKLSEPCNKCENCRRIANGSSLVCVEMDAASNRGIDDIRTLRERIGLAPAEGRFTTYIIDEVHMLTTEAFNALLKTLEEPPEHVVFFLCTTDPQKIPDTVISRCTRVQFKKATKVEVVKSLMKAIGGEKLDLEDGVVELIAERVDGSFRDGMKTLEQLAQTGERITVVMVNELMGFGGDYETNTLITALVARDIAAALEVLAQKQSLGIDLGVYGKRLVEALRERVYEVLATNNEASFELIQLAKHINGAVSLMKQSVVPALPLELAVAEWCLEDGKDLPVKRKPNLPPANSNTPSVIIKRPVVPPVVVVEVEKKIQVEPEVKQSVAKEKQASVKPSEKDEPVVIGAFSGNFQDILAKWQEILTAVKPHNHSLEALLRSARPHSFEDGRLTVEAFYKFHKEQLEQDRHRRKVEEVVSEIMGGNIQLQFLLKAAGASDIKLDNISGSVEDEALAQAAEEIFGK